MSEPTGEREGLRERIAAEVCGAMGTHARDVFERGEAALPVNVESGEVVERIARKAADRILDQLAPAPSLSVRPEPDATEFLAKDNLALKRAGDALAVAATQVTSEYDGVHRLRLAVADWSKAVADEGGRAERYARAAAPAPSLDLDAVLAEALKRPEFRRKFAEAYWLDAPAPEPVRAEPEMRRIQHEETGRITEIPAGQPLPPRWYAIPAAAPLGEREALAAYESWLSSGGDVRQASIDIFSAGFAAGSLSSRDLAILTEATLVLRSSGVNESLSGDLERVLRRLSTGEPAAPEGAGPERVRRPTLEEIEAACAHYREIGSVDWEEAEPEAMRQEATAWLRAWCRVRDTDFAAAPEPAESLGKAWLANRLKIEAMDHGGARIIVCDTDGSYEYFPMEKAVEVRRIIVAALSAPAMPVEVLLELAERHKPHWASAYRRYAANLRELTIAIAGLANAAPAEPAPQQEPE